MQADLEISETIYTKKCKKESSEAKGTSDKGAAKETSEDVEHEKPVSVFNVMEESDFTDRVIPEKKKRARSCKKFTGKGNGRYNKSRSLG